ncbi:DUF4349 domain-containing protein [Sphingopyxis indica]|uniref:hypothetical protein n=1 Tax=Sphingopyxis indica TaxID=436663 RepID=UPI0029394231|nr:hypothetical protein [Sphingopyxis indica]WOF41843.1 DUF4349 domain-containing protein [Sphingopyxis indica]
MKIKLLAGAMALVLAGCSENRSDRTYEGSSASESLSDAAGGPDVAVTAAPGVAFHYAYAFRLDDDRIANVQERHAAACEALGIARCRITGLSYRLVRENEVEAQLRFKLDPAIARKFGRDALASVEKAEGVLAETRIDGEDVGTQIDDSQHRSAELSAEVARIEARLGKGGLGDRERTELQEQLAGLRERLTSERAVRSDGEAMLATTPMVFDYIGTGGLPGIGYGNPFSDAAAMLVRSGSLLLSFVLVAGAAILPWAIAWVLALLLWRSPPVRALRGRLSRASTSEATVKAD